MIGSALRTYVRGAGDNSLAVVGAVARSVCIHSGEFQHYVYPHVTPDVIDEYDSPLL